MKKYKNIYFLSKPAIFAGSDILGGSGVLGESAIFAGSDILAGSFWGTGHICNFCRFVQLVGICNFFRFQPLEILG